MFAQAGASLPASTKVVLAATDLLREQGYLLLALVAALLLMGERGHDVRGGQAVRDGAAGADARDHLVHGGAGMKIAQDVAADHQCRRQVEAAAQAGGERPAQLGRDAVT